MTDPDVGGIEAFVSAAAGAVFDELLAAMLDYSTPPMMLGRDHPGCLGHAYERCLVTVRDALESAGSDAALRLQGDLPWHLEEGDLAVGLVEAATEARYFVTPGSVFDAVNDDARAYALHPSLRERLDGDGLLDLEGLDARGQVLLYEGTGFSYHQFLRRHFTSHINYGLVEAVLRVGAPAGNRVRVAIDERRAMPASDYSEFMEKDYWFGPPLSDAWLDDPHRVGTVVHADPGVARAPEYPRFFAYWRIDGDGNKVVQMEELSEHASANHAGMRVVRYLHAIRDIKRGTFVHCDGAVRAYTPEAYEHRAAETMPTSTKATRYRKLFRIDGVIGTSDWSDLVARWFRHNSLATEYLTGLAPDEKPPC
jgi:hypothetical protein